MTDIRQIRHFIAVAEEKHFRIAAERLHMTQPPLSHSIKKLEQTLNVTLLTRANRSVTLTPAGEVFLKGAYEILEKLNQVTEDTRRASQGLTGRLTLGFVGSAIYEALPDTVRQFRQTFPNVEVELEELSTVDQLDAISKGSIDAGLLRPPVAGRGLFDLTTIRQEKLIVVMPQSHPQADKKAVRLSSLSEDGFILFPLQTSPNLHALVLHACHQAGFTPRISQTASQIQTQISLVSAGLGIALVPQCVRQAVHSGVVYKDLEGADKEIETHMAIACKQGHKNSLLTAFIECCRPFPTAT
ncbi:LysR family transcriptional regulator [Sneathiella aquimaris]|uniref:LysR family transcriptional regulator n=1 Tax=Sneathiella aquimaris TaxID=2599305 RepID=UPI001469FD90|nr:LysR family transcriptional regulator [Sneathiella aquimaris]